MNGSLTREGMIRHLTDRINELEEENARLKADLIHNDPCEVCFYAREDQLEPTCICECEVCTKKCMCDSCYNSSNFKWRGEK